MSDRYNNWMRRYSRGHLGVGHELWAEIDQQDPAFVRLVELGQARNREVDESTARYYLTRTLLTDIITAAGGIDYAFDSMQSKLAESQALSEKYHEKIDAKKEPEFGRWMSGPEVSACSFEFMNLLNWTRTLDERLERNFRGRKSGLVHAVAPGQLRDDVTAAITRLGETWRDARYLSNYVLHAGAVPYPNARARIANDGSVFIPVPDALIRPVQVWDEFTYEEGRHVTTYGQKLLSTLGIFMDELLTAFEKAVPDRFRTAHLEQT